ncbi:MAG: hypothetical protein ACI9G1_005698 [Pirellulaceae bacterium]|jgi:hypothetical protein
MVAINKNSPRSVSFHRPAGLCSQSECIGYLAFNHTTHVTVDLPQALSCSQVCREVVDCAQVAGAIHTSFVHQMGTYKE